MHHKRHRLNKRIEFFRVQVKFGSFKSRTRWIPKSRLVEFLTRWSDGGPVEKIGPLSRYKVELINEEE